MQSVPQYDQSVAGVKKHRYRNSSVLRVHTRGLQLDALQTHIVDGRDDELVDPVLGSAWWTEVRRSKSSNRRINLEYREDVHPHANSQ